MKGLFASGFGNPFSEFGMKGRDNLTEKLGGRTILFKRRISSDSMMELLKGVVLFKKAVLLCHFCAGKGSNHTAVAHSTLWWWQVG